MRRRNLLRTAARAVIACGAAVLAGGCGFQLRQSAGLPFRALYAEFPSNSTIDPNFRRLVRTSGDTRLLDRPQGADASLLVISETREKEITAFSATGRPREYQIRLRLVYRLADARGEELMPPTTLLVRRDLTTTDTQIVAKEQEEALLYREMENDLVQQLLRRLASVGR